MKRIGIGLALLLVAGLLVLLLRPGGADPASEAEPADERPRVLTTTSILADNVRGLLGDLVQVESLMGPGIDPHLYKASAGDVERLRNADLVVYNGLHLEGRMVDMLAALPRQGRRVVAVAERVPTARRIAADDDAYAWDPHVWMDVGLYAQALQAVPGAVREMIPDAVDEIGARAVRYLADLQALDAEVRRRIGAIPAEQRVLVTAHDAFSYFGRAYDIEVRGLLGVSTAAEAGTGEVAELAAFIVERRIPAIFAETTVSSRLLEALRDSVRARGGEVGLGGQLYSDALGDSDGPAGTYIGMIRENVATIEAGLLAGGGANAAEAKP